MNSPTCHGMDDAAERLRKWRQRADKPAGKLSLLKAAQELKCDPTSLSKIENRHQVPGLKLAIRIEKLCGIKMLDWGSVVLTKKAPAKKASAKKAA